MRSRSCKEETALAFLTSQRSTLAASPFNNVLARTPPPPHLLDFEPLKNPPQFLVKNFSKRVHQLECRNGMANVSIPGSIGLASRTALAHCEASKLAIALYK
jgi:hypothetical protein